MEHGDFSIGVEFWLTGCHYRCTDVGTRTIAAIRIDYVDVVHVSKDGTESRRTLDYDQANAEGWFNGPSYAVAERLFDENDLPGCTARLDEQ